MNGHHPDLSTRAGRRAYRHELRMVAVRPRRVGLGLLLAGLVVMALPLAAGIHAIAGFSPQFLGLAMAALGVPFLIAGMALRTRYHRRRMQGHPPAGTGRTP
jgi:predicted transporter